MTPSNVRQYDDITPILFAMTDETTHSLLKESQRSDPKWKPHNQKRSLHQTDFSNVRPENRVDLESYVWSVPGLVTDHTKGTITNTLNTYPRKAVA